LEVAQQKRERQPKRKACGRNKKKARRNIQELGQERGAEHHEKSQRGTEENQGPIAAAQKVRTLRVIPRRHTSACLASHEQRKRACGQADESDQGNDRKDASVIGGLKLMRSERLERNAQQPGCDRPAAENQVVRDDMLALEQLEAAPSLRSGRRR
jgi:hypothetical protein